MALAIYANNAFTTIAGSINSTATSVNLASGTGALFPTLSGGQFFVATFIGATNPLLTEIVHVTAISGDTVTIVRGQEGTTAQSWSAGDLFQNLVTAGYLNGLVQAVSARQVLTANLILYVSASGSDSNPGTSSLPFATMQHAWNTILDSYDLAGFAVTVNVSAGTYAGLLASGSAVGEADTFSAGLDLPSITFTGTSANIAVSTGNNIQAQNGARVGYGGFTFTNTASGTGNIGIAVLAISGGIAVMTSPCVFGACSNAHLASVNGGQIGNSAASYTITGSTNSHILVDSCGTLTVGFLTVTLSGTPGFTQGYALATRGGVSSLPSITFSGSATGPRYTATLNGVISVNGAGATYLPGNSSGSTSAGGQYA